jgi:hypothetical protein
MALYLEIGRPWGNAMVSKRSPVRDRASAWSECRSSPSVVVDDLDGTRVRLAELVMSPVEHVESLSRGIGPVVGLRGESIVLALP